MGYVLGIDLGTSSLKGILMDETGNLISEKSKEYPIDIPSSGFSQQNPKDWLRACEAVFKKLRAEVADFGEKLEGISFSGQMHTLVVLDKAGEPVYPAILWNDVRTSQQCKRIKEEFGAELLAITKNIPLEGFTLPKILWLQENEPEIWERVHTLMMPKDYLRYWLTGNMHMEYSDAAGTLLLDIEKQQWSQAVTKKFQVAMEQLPELVSSLASVGNVREELRSSFGFDKEVKVFAGGADNACAALGAGLIDETVGLVSIGTSGVLSSFEPSVKNYHGTLHFFNHVMPDSYYSMGVTLAAGNSLSWFKRTFLNELSFEEMLKDIGQIQPGSENLLFTPYIVGERTPHFDSTIRGSFIGIDTRHSLLHFTRSVLEGITFSLKDTQEIMATEKHSDFQRIISVGGGAKNLDWLQMQADIFEADIVRLTSEQGPGLGACMIAALGCGWFDDMAGVIDTFVHYQEEIVSPIQENVDKYRQVYQVWKKIYSATKNIFEETATIN